MSVSIGMRLGRYELRERLGKGGMATVYKGWDTNLDRWVAVKVLHEYLAEEPDFSARFQREAKTVASLNHPNIVQVYDFDIVASDKQPVAYMVMAHIPGKSLKQLMDEYAAKGQTIPLDQIKDIMQSVTAALGYAHERGMVHRDVTPGNILFNEQGQAVLADFGIARMVLSDRQTQTGTTTGTPVYMSPEQGVGRPGDHRSDIYALGVILYEMLSGKAPFRGESAIAVILSHVNDPIPPLSTKAVPAGNTAASLGTVVNRALAKAPENRYQSAMEMNKAFLTAIGDMSVRKTLDAPTSTSTYVVSTTGVNLPSRSMQLRALLQPQKSTFLPIVIGVAIVAAAGVFILAQLTSSTSKINNVVISNTAAVPTPALVVAPIPTDSFAPSMTGGPMPFSDSFDNLLNTHWKITTDNPQIYRNIENGQYHLRTTLPHTAMTTLYYDVVQYPSDYVYEADFKISTDSQPETGTGIIFRYRKDRDFTEQYYVFAVNGMGQFSIWQRVDGVWTELRGLTELWTSNPNIKPTGEANHLKLVDAGRTLTGYVNGVQVVEIEQEPSIPSGAVGVYLATSQIVAEPISEVFVDNFSATELKKTK